MKNNKLFLSLVLTIALVAPSFTNAELNADIDPQGESACVALQNNLRYRSTDAQTNSEVSILQDYLQSTGYLDSNPSGFFGLLTFAAVKKFQTASSIEPTGFVGPLTQAQIKAVSCGGSSVDTTVHATGCSAGAVYNSQTGAPCKTPVPNTNDCSPGAVYSSITGARCTDDKVEKNASTITILYPPDGNKTYTVQANGYFAIPFSWVSNHNLVYPWIYLMNANASTNDPAVASINLPANTKSGQGVLTASSLINAGTVLPAGQYKVKVCDQSTDIKNPLCGTSVRSFTVGGEKNTSTDSSCLLGVVYSSITGARCSDITSGCPVGQVYNTYTGALCGTIPPTTDGCPPGQMYSSVTGALCPSGTSQLSIVLTDRVFLAEKNLQRGQIIPLNFISKGVRNVDVRLSSSAGTIKDFYFDAVDGNNQVSITIPNDFPTGAAKLYIIDNSTSNSTSPSAIFDMVQGYVYITAGDTAPPSITVVSPNGGETWKRGELQSVTYTSTSYDEITAYLEKYYSIYSSTPAATYFITKTSHKGVETVFYPLPANSELSSGQFTAYKIKICSDTTCANYDKSDNFFKVVE